MILFNVFFGDSDANVMQVAIVTVSNCQHEKWNLHHIQKSPIL
jgi:hypothetical protein